MSADWQTWAVYAVVAATAIIMIYRTFFKKAGCGGECGCPTQSQKAKWIKENRSPKP